MNDTFDIRKVLAQLWTHKYFILIFTFLVSIFSIYFALSLQNEYTSSATFAINEDDSSSIASSINQYSSVASIAGINLSSNSSSKKSFISGTLRSREFYKELNKEPLLAANFLAASHYDHQTKKIIYKENIFDANSNTWLRDPPPGRLQKPSYLELYDEVSNLLFFSFDKDTGYLKLSFTSISPEFSRNFLDLVFVKLNQISKIQDEEKASSSIKYLSGVLENIEQTDIKRLVTKLLENNLQTLTLTNSNQYYLLEPIDPPFIPEVKSSPFRALLVISSTLMGLFFASILTLLMPAFKDFLSHTK